MSALLCSGVAWRGFAGAWVCGYRRVRLLQVKPRAAAGPFTGHRLQVAFTQDQVGFAGHLDLVLVLGAEEHPLAELDRADVLSDSGHLAPDEPLGHLCGRRDQ